MAGGFQVERAAFGSQLEELQLTQDGWWWNEILVMIAIACWFLLRIGAFRSLLTFVAW